MKLKAILLASLFMGCQIFQYIGNTQQHVKSFSKADQGKVEDFISSTRWLGDVVTLTQNQDFWTFIGNELGVLKNSLFCKQKQQQYLRNKSYRHNDDVAFTTKPYMNRIAKQIKRRGLLRSIPMRLVPPDYSRHRAQLRFKTDPHRGVPHRGVHRSMNACMNAILYMIQRNILNKDWWLSAVNGSKKICNSNSQLLPLPLMPLDDNGIRVTKSSSLHEQQLQLQQKGDIISRRGSPHLK